MFKNLTSVDMIVISWRLGQTLFRIIAALTRTQRDYNRDSWFEQMRLNINKE